MKLKTCLFTALAAAQASLLVACNDLQPTGVKARDEAQSRALARKLQAACASTATYDRLKQVAFDEAIRIRNADPVNLDTLASHSFVRMENPRVVSRNEELDVTVCNGRFVLVLPPGAEPAFDGERQIVAEIEYAAQAAADGSGLVYQIKGAEPIIYKLAAFDLKNRSSRQTVPRTAVLEPLPAAPAPEPAPVATPPLPAAQPQPRATPVASKPIAPAPRNIDSPARDARSVRSPSFNCRRARTNSERMVCSDGELAALDRAMSSRYYSALGNVDPSARTELRRTRDRFLGARERCATARCIAQVYADRMDEIADIAEQQ